MSTTIATLPAPVVVQSSEGKVFSFPTPDGAQQFDASVRAAGGETIHLVPAERSKSLFDLESDLDALVETIEMVAPGQQEEFLADFSTALQAAKEKRDRVHWFMCFLEAAIIADDLEKKRLDKRTARFGAALDRLDHYVTSVIKGLGPDAKGKWRKLEGTTVVLKLNNNPPAVAVTDEAAVPSRYKTVGFTLPAPLWDEVCDSMDMELLNRVLDAVKKPSSAVVKTLVKEAIAEAIPGWKEQLKDKPAVFCDAVPGASIAAGGTKLVRE